MCVVGVGVGGVDGVISGVYFLVVDREMNVSRQAVRHTQWKMETTFGAFDPRPGGGGGEETERQRQADRDRQRETERDRQKEKGKKKKTKKKKRERVM